MQLNISHCLPWTIVLSGGDISSECSNALVLVELLFSLPRMAN